MSSKQIGFFSNTLFPNFRNSCAVNSNMKTRFNKRTLKKQGELELILILDPSSAPPSSAPAHIHVFSSDQVMQRLSQQSRLNNNQVVAISGAIRLCTFKNKHHILTCKRNRLKQALGTEASFSLGSKQALIRKMHVSNFL